MTEQEWLSSADPAAMLALFFRPFEAARALTAPKISDRKLRLFACAYDRFLPPRHGNWHKFREAISWSERVADGLSYGEVPFWCKRWRSCPTTGEDAACGVTEDLRDEPDAGPRVAALLRCIVGNPFRPVTLPKVKRCGKCGWDGNGPNRKYCDRSQTFDGKVSHLWKESCPWLTPTVVMLANRAYEDRTKQLGEDEQYEALVTAIKTTNYRCLLCGYVATVGLKANHRRFCSGEGTLDGVTLAVLADALEEAGCPGEVESESTEEYCDAFMYGCDEFGAMDACAHKKTRKVVSRTTHPLLQHLRSPGVHVRGCWAVDLLLGRE